MDSVQNEKLHLKIFDGDGFFVWKFQMETMYAAKKLLRLVNGEELRPVIPTGQVPSADDIKQQEIWEDKDATAKYLLCCSLSTRILGKLTTCQDTHAMWTKLNALHLTEEDVFSLLAKFYDYKMSQTDDISSHVQNITNMAVILANLKHPLPESWIITKMISSLPPSYNDVIAAWWFVDPLKQTADLLEERLLRHEAILKRQGHFDEGSDKAFFTRSAGASSTTPRQRFSRKDQHRKDVEYLKDLKSRAKCLNCGKRGAHWTADCPEPHKKPLTKPGGKPYSGLTAANISEAMYTTTLSDNSDTYPSSDDEPVLAFKVSTCSTAFLTSSLLSDKWYADLAATEHMTNRREWFTTFNSIDEGVWPVIVADNKTIWVKGRGDIKIIRHVNGRQLTGTLLNVIYIPDLARNLLSVGTVSDAGYIFLAESLTQPGNCDIRTKDGKLVMEGKRVNNLYELSLTVVPPPVTSPAASSVALVTHPRDKSDYNDMRLWHFRMGHVNYRTLQHMSSQNSLQDFKLKNTTIPQELCHGCMQGKHSKASYPTDVNKLRNLPVGTFLHGDTSGKIACPSLGGSQYFILYKDDTSCYRFVLCARNKDAAFPFFQKVVKIVRRDQGIEVKKLRTDQGREYLNKEFTLFLDQHGIHHELSTTYTPQQNGFLERDNRTVMECARSMLHAFSLPTHLWAEAVNCAVYLLNRTTNKQLGSVTPYEKWFGHKPSVSHYRVFGSLAYVHINKEVRTKLDPKSLPVIFVGYSLHSRGYRLWDPHSDKIIESNDVHFDERPRRFNLALFPNLEPMD